MQAPEGRQEKPEPSSRLTYHLEVDSGSLPAGVSVRVRQVPGSDRVQSWIRNESETPLIVLTVNAQGAVIRRQKLVDRRVYLAGSPREEAEHSVQWQHLEGVEEVLLSLSYTPEAVIRGRLPDAGAATEVPPPEPFSIPALFGAEERPITGKIVYSLDSRPR